MKGKFLSLSAVFIGTSVFLNCSQPQGLSDADAQRLSDGPNSLKGTITGTRLDGTPFSFTYDYHVSKNDFYSYSQSYFDNTTQDTVLHFYQEFHFDEHGPDAAWLDNSSASGRVASLELYINMNSMKIEPLDPNYPDNYSRGLIGMWQIITPEGNRFVFGALNYCSCNTNQAGGSLDVTDLKYEINSQILSGKLKMSLEANNTVSNGSDNHNATTITGDFKFYVPRENFQVVKGSSDNGTIYRTKSH